MSVRPHRLPTRDAAHRGHADAAPPRSTRWCPYGAGLARGALVLPVALVVLVAVLVGGCGRKHRGDLPAASRTLAVMASLPEGELASRSSVEVVFDRPVVPAGAADPTLEEGRAILAIDPEPPGSYHWVGTRTLAFVVPRGVPSATEFRARVPAGIQALDGTRLADPAEWTFSTPRPAVVAAIPDSGDSLFRPGDPIALLFNQPVDPAGVASAASLGSGIVLTADRPDSAAIDSLGWRFTSEDPARIVRIHPSPALERGRAYTLELDAGLRGTSGPRTLGTDWKLPFRTYGPPGIVGVTSRGQFEIGLRTPVDKDSLLAYLTIEPRPDGLDAYTTASSAILFGVIGYGARYTVKVREGLPDLFGQRTDAPFEGTLTTDDRPPRVALVPRDATLLAALPREAAVQFGGVAKTRVTAVGVSAMEDRTDPPQLQSYTGPWTVDQELPAEGDKNALTTKMIDLSRLFPGERTGTAIVQARAEWTDQKGKLQFLQERSRLHWTDIGITCKEGPESGWAWVTRLASGEPVPGASLSIQDGLGRVVWRGTSEPDGGVHLPGSRDLADDPSQLSLFASVGEDTNWIGLNGDWRLSGWALGAPGDHDDPATDERAFLFTDRGLYRPGDVIRMSGFVRRLGTEGIGRTALDSVRVVATDPQSAAIADTVIPVDDEGGFALDVATSPAMRLETYTLEARAKVRPVRVRPDSVRWHPIGWTHARLAAYRAPSFRVSVSCDRRDLFPEEPLTAAVTGAYYFGAPLARAPFTWTLGRRREAFAPEGFGGFAFEDPEAFDREASFYGEGNGALDDSGGARVGTRVPASAFLGPQVLTFEANVSSPSGDVVSARDEVRFHPASVYAGLALERAFVDAGDEAGVRVVAVDAVSGNPVGGARVALEFTRREWRSVAKLVVGGRIDYEATRVDSLLDTRTVTTQGSAVTARWTPPGPGSYRVTARVRDARGRENRAATEFFASGEGETGGWREEAGPRLTLVPDRALYDPGETARILLTSPVEAARAVVTIEREGVASARIVDLSGEAPVFEIPVRPEYQPNVFVGVTVVEPQIPESEAPGIPDAARLPRVRSGYAVLRVDSSRRKLTVVVEPDRDEYGPGEDVTLSIDVHDERGAGAPGRVSLAVVDEAVLALLGTPVPDPFGFFYKDRGLGVKNGDTRLDLSAGAEAEAPGLKGGPGGGGGEASQGTRSQFATTAFWDPAIETDPRGQAEVTFRLPDNLTRFRIAAVAASRMDRFGSGSSSFRVTKSLALEPALPRFAVAGDTIDLAVLAVNRAGRPLSGTIALETGLVLLSPAGQNLSLAAGETRRVSFRATAARAGETRVSFRADLSGTWDALETWLPVAAPVLTRSAVLAGSAGKTAEERIVLPAEAIAGTDSVRVGVAASAIAGAGAAFSYVLDYPFGCAEQTASRLLALVLLDDLTEDDPLALAGHPDIEGEIIEATRRLEAMAYPWGGFAFWSQGSDAPPAVAAYATFALARARISGAPVAEEVVRSQARRLAQWWRDERGDGDTLSAFARLPVGFGLLAVTLAEESGAGRILQDSDLHLLADHVKEMSEEDRVLFALALASRSQRPDLVKRILKSAKGRAEASAAGVVIPAFESSLAPAPFRSDTRATALTLLLAARVSAKDPMVGRLARGLLDLRSGGHWRNTQDDVMALLALAEYRRLAEKRDQPVIVEVGMLLPGGATDVILSHEFPRGSLARVTAPARSTGAAPGGRPVALRFASKKGGTLHYEGRLDWTEPALGAAALEGGFTLLRRVEPFRPEASRRAAGNAAAAAGASAPIGLGGLVKITLTVVVPRESHFLAIRDPLPAGLEAAQMGFVTESREESAALAAMRPSYPQLPTSSVERRDREVRLFADFVAPGIYEYAYLARARAVGAFAHLPATIEAMYAPEWNARSASGRVVVEEAGAGR